MERVLRGADGWGKWETGGGEWRGGLGLEGVGAEGVGEGVRNGGAVGPGGMPLEVGKCLGESALKFLTKLYDGTMEGGGVPE